MFAMTVGSGDLLRAQVTPYGSQEPGRAPIRLANNRVDFVIPGNTVELGKPTKVRLIIHVPGLKRLHIIQSRVAEGGRREPIRAGDAEADVLADTGEGASVSVVPMGIGRLELLFFGKYPDGAAVIERMQVEVVPPTVRPKRLVVGEASNPQKMRQVIFVFLRGSLTKEELGVSAMYDSLPVLVQLDPAMVMFRVYNDAAGPSIDFDPRTAVITPRKIGETLIETTFRGLTVRTCVVVRENEGVGSYAGPFCRGFPFAGPKSGVR